MARLRLVVASVAVSLVFAGSLGCTTGAKSDARPAVPLELTLKFDDHDQISVEHVERLLDRADVLSWRTAGQGFKSWSFGGVAADRARSVLQADASWPEIEARC